LKALLVVDMLNDFVTGVVPNGRALRIVPAIRRLIDHARASSDWLVVYANDAHRADDREVERFGRHAMAGTAGAMVIDPLAPIGAEREIVVSKRYYGAFDGTDLDDILYDYEIEDLVITGQHLQSAVLHTAYGGFVAGYNILVPVDAVCALDGIDETAWLKRLEALYAAELTSSTGLVGRPVLRTATSRA
jgi:nicotinamidase-related amidase